MDISQAKTIKEQVKFLETHAHCLGIDVTMKNDCVDMKKYFIYDRFSYDRRAEIYVTDSYGFVVYYKKIEDNYEPVQIIKNNPSEIQLMVDCMGLHFGE